MYPAVAVMSNEYYTAQGCAVDGGILYEGVSIDPKQYIYAWDVDAGKCVAKIPLPLSGYECEGVTIYDGKMYAVQRSKTMLSIYTISLD